MLCIYSAFGVEGMPKVTNHLKQTNDMRRKNATQICLQIFLYERFLC